MSDVKSFARKVFTHSFQDSSDKRESTAAPPEESGDTLKINFAELAVPNTAVSVQLVLWSLTEESGITMIGSHKHCQVNMSHLITKPVIYCH